MKVTTEEFNKFWDEVLGKDWYTDEGEIVEDEPLVELSDMVLAWQGTGAPEPNGILKARDLLDGPRTYLSATTIFKRWKKAQSTTVVLATFEVPNENKDALLEQIKAMGGKVVR